MPQRWRPGWSGYFNSLLQDFGIYIPPELTATPGTQLVFYNHRWERLPTVLATLQARGTDPSSLPQATGSFNVIAFLAICLITAILVIGIKESARLNNAVVLIKVSIVLVFIGVASIFVLKNPDIATANWHPFIPPNTGEFGKFGLSGIARGAAVIFFAYIGFDAVSTAAQETRNPEKDMPIGILGSLVICTILYILVAGLLTGVVKYTALNVPDPVAVGVDAAGVGGIFHVGGHAIKISSFLVKAGAIAGLG